MSTPLDPSPDAINFQHRLAELRNGSLEEFGRLLETFRGYLLVVAAGELPSAMRAKLGASDLVQETLLKAHRHLAQFRGETPEELLGWLREIMCNCLIDAARQFQVTQMRQLAREVPLPGGETDERCFDPQDSAPTPHTAAVVREESQVLAAALDCLPAQYRQVVQLRSWERLPFDDVGRRLNCTAEAARKLWFRAVERLRSELDVQLG